MKKVILLILMILLPKVHASIDGALNVYLKSGNTNSGYVKMASELVEDGLYFTSVPFIKEYLSTSGSVNNSLIDDLVDKIVTNVGVKQFEILPLAVLKKSKAPTIQYIIARKLFRDKKYSTALSYLGPRIPRGHPVKPYALMLEGSIYSIAKKFKTAEQAYEQCKSESKSAMGKTDDPNRLKQLAINRDYCTVGPSRAQFAAREFEKANLSYLDLPKESYIWPEILFEEAWNSFYQRDYNRTLGKLVTYKAPVFDFIFNPEIEVLRSLTYLELCLWNDAREVVDRFYGKYQKEAVGLRRFLRTNGRDYKLYYLMAKERLKGPVRGNKLLNQLLKSITKEASYLELFEAFLRGKEELAKVKSVSNRRFRAQLARNLKESLLLQRDLVGAYVRKTLYLHFGTIQEAFQGMSYIKLEVLSRRKTELLNANYDMNRRRGDIKYLQRNDKQYFWTFNGEFWADELGDYVFSLKSECKG